MSHKRKIYISLVVGLILSGVAFYVAFRNVPFDDLLGYLKTVNYWWVLPSVAFGLAGFVIRTLRWQLLLSPVKRTSFWSAFHPLMIGFSLNMVMPARLGELARPAIFYKKERVPFSRVLATVGAERIFDVVMLLFFFVIVFATVEIDPKLDLTFGDYHLNKATLALIGKTTLTMAVFLIAGVLLVSARGSRKIIRRLILILPNLFVFFSDALKEKLQNKIFVRLADAVDHFAVGLDMLKSPKKIGLCMGLSFVAWFFAGVSHYVFSIGCPGIGVSFLEMCAVMVILCFFISLPSAPGFWGLWEVGGLFGLLIFGIPSKEAAGFTLVNHFFQIAPIMVVGLFSAFVTGVSLFKVPSGIYEKPGNN